MSCPQAFQRLRQRRGVIRGKLIFIEGIPGSGKTTTAQFIRDWYDQHGVIPHLFLEGDLNHPADFESVARLNLDEYASLIAQFGDLKGFLEQVVVVKGQDYLFHYRKLQQEHADKLPAPLYEALARYEIYDRPRDTYERLILERWANFVAQPIGQDEVYIFECCFLQNPLTTLLGRHNADVESACAYVLRLADFLAKLHPLLIYLQPDSVQATLQRVAATRPQSWVDFLIVYFTGQGYGKAHGLRGFDGVIKFYEFRQAVELGIFQRLGWRKLLIDNSAWNWPACYETIGHFLAVQGLS